MNYQFIAFTFGDTMTYRGKADCGLPTVRFRFRNQVDVVVPFVKASVLNTESRGEDLKSVDPLVACLLILNVVYDFYGGAW